jgi:membrane associated rhomboid family serine protease
MIPLRDVIPSRTTPYITITIIVLNGLAWLFELSLPHDDLNRFLATFGVVPAYFAWPTLITSMFLHGGWMHLIGNMWFLWIFGDNVEERLGPIRYIIFYLLVGAAGALAQAFSLPSSTAPMIGASGAIAGVLGGYVMLFPRAKVVTFVAIPLLWHVRDVTAWIFLGIWFLGQFLIPSNSGVAWMAHVGGFLAGLGAVRLLAKSRPSSPTPADVEYLPPPRRNQSW